MTVEMSYSPLEMKSWIFSLRNQQRLMIHYLNQFMKGINLLLYFGIVIKEEIGLLA